NLLDGIVERGFDGRNIGFRVFFDPGAINIADPFPGLTAQQIHDQFFGPPQDPLGALDNHLTTPYVQYWSGGFQWELSKGLVLSMDVVHSLGLKGILSNPFNYQADRGPAVTDQRHRFIFSAIVDPSRLPPFFGNGWEIALISSYNTPLPYDITAGTQSDGITPLRPAGIQRNNGNRGSQSALLADINAYRAGQGLPLINRQLTPNDLNFRSTDLRLSRTIPL